MRNIQASSGQRWGVMGKDNYYWTEDGLWIESGWAYGLRGGRAEATPAFLEEHPRDPVQTTGDLPGPPLGSQSRKPGTRR